VYRFRVTAARYSLNSTPFHVVPATTLTPVTRDDVVRLTYPEPIIDVDITARPAAAGAAIPPGGARDRYGNRNG
jgi:hypothetical protein